MKTPAGRSSLSANSMKIADNATKPMMAIAQYFMVRRAFTVGCEKPKDAPKDGKMEGGKMEGGKMEGGKMEGGKATDPAAATDDKMEDKDPAPLETPADPTAPAETK